MPSAKKHDFSASERKYSELWKKERVYEPSFAPSSAKLGTSKPFYNLMMFPYPSAEGLHVGNMYAFTGADVYGRMKRMQGHDVFEPIGLDGFGIHSENYALKVGTHPIEQAEKSAKNFYKQLEMIGNGFAWDEKLETYDPEYYRWTQWLFIQMWKAGLAYRKKQSVNWCVSCKTVLADEQVIQKSKFEEHIGVCERCETPVERRELEQWFFRITKYAEKLLKNLDDIDWSERVKIAQRNWIGKSEGARIKFQIPNSKFQIREIEVFTTRPDTILGATFMVLSPELASEWMGSDWDAPAEVKEYVKEALLRRGKQMHEEQEKTGVFSGLYAVNPATKQNIPLWVSDYVLAGYGTGAIMAVPAHDERDREFAKKFNLPISDAPLEDVKRIVKKVGGKLETQYRLRDWLISRQRYWGPPIPMIFCESCAATGKGERKDMPGWYAVPEKDLPVKLPYVKEWKPMGTGMSPLASVKDFYEVKCPKCGNVARRETDVSDTFLDSSWYYLGYLAKQDFKFQILDSKFRSRVKRWLPVNMYIGGLEHAVLHLLYVRFVTMALKDMGHVGFEEPIVKFRTHGLLIKDGAKMSKSKGNVINPDEYIKKFGADAFRMYLMFLAPFEEGGDFRDEGILGPVRFLERVRNLSTYEVNRLRGEKAFQKLVNKTVKKVTDDIESLHYNTAISALMTLLNVLEKEKSHFTTENLEIFLKLLAPFAPFLAEELWREKLGYKDSIHKSEWPSYDEKYLKEDTFTLVVQVNGKMRGQVEVRSGITEHEAKEQAKEAVKKYLAGSVKKTIYVKERLVNFVVEE